MRLSAFFFFLAATNMVVTFAMILMAAGPTAWPRFWAAGLALNAALFGMNGTLAIFATIEEDKDAT